MPTADPLPRRLVVERYTPEDDRDLVAALLPDDGRADTIRLLVAAIPAGWHPAEPRIRILEAACAAYNRERDEEEIPTLGGGDPDDARVLLVIDAITAATNAAEANGEYDLSECLDLLQMVWGIGGAAGARALLQRLGEDALDALVAAGAGTPA